MIDVQSEPLKKVVTTWLQAVYCPAARTGPRFDEVCCARKRRKETPSLERSVAETPMLCMDMMLGVSIFLYLYPSIYDFSIHLNKGLCQDCQQQITSNQNQGCQLVYSPVYFPINRFYDIMACWPEPKNCWWQVPYQCLKGSCNPIVLIRQ